MLDALPHDGQRYEIIDGELFVTCTIIAGQVQLRPKRIVLRRAGR